MQGGGRTTEKFSVGSGFALAAGCALLVAAAVYWMSGQQLQATQWVGYSEVVAILFAALAAMYMLERRRRAAAERLHLSEERFRLLADNAVDFAVIVLDAEGRVVSWNPGAQRIKGYEAGEILGSHFSRFYPAEDVAGGKPARELERAARDGRVEDEGWRLRKDGSRFWANVVITALRDPAGELLGFGKLTRDLSERQRVEQELRTEVEERRRVDAELQALNVSLEQKVAERTAQLEESGRQTLKQTANRAHAEQLLERSEAHLRGVLDSAMDAIITVDEEQTVVMFNAAAEGLFGCPREQALGASLDRFIPERFRAHHGEYIRHFVHTAVSSRMMGGLRIVTGLRADGSEFPIDASISQVAKNGNRFYTVILRDVTERVRVEEQLRRSRDELRELGSAGHSAREQEKTRIARELHDELGQALTALKMDVAWLNESLPAGTPVADKLAAMQTLLDGTVAATRRISADLRPMVLDDLGLTPAIEWLVQSFTQRTGTRCKLDLGSADLELEDVHATAVFRIVQESLTNIARYAQASLVEVTLQRGGGEIRVAVSDNGRGFDPGDTRKPKSFGLLGLRERAYLLGGSIAITSAPGRGTRIEISIPDVMQEPNQ